jgi:hypothetical protein
VGWHGIPYTGSEAENLSDCAYASAPEKIEMVVKPVHSCLSAPGAAARLKMFKISIF